MLLFDIVDCSIAKFRWCHYGQWLIIVRDVGYPIGWYLLPQAKSESKGELH